MATRSTISHAEHKSRARDLALANLNDALALLEVLRDQVKAAAAEAAGPTCHYGHAGDAQCMAHDLRRIAVRAFTKPNGAEADAEVLLDAAVAAKVAP